MVQFLPSKQVFVPLPLKSASDLVVHPSLYICCPCRPATCTDSVPLQTSDSILTGSTQIGNAS
ncbi:hypothetical protein E2C01_100177 [Portunus trituberculatus]|uniref:Uncharacterized protein n=1 Tax=Portunus trituberculatus TaxID=210409 RepID=A0A5B7KIQ9_PORTR|nr:hypothetical protein [Portunus trituberculatus]